VAIGQDVQWRQVSTGYSHQVFVAGVLIYSGGDSAWQQLILGNVEKLWQ
jgi:hypothetical protein